MRLLYQSVGGKIFYAVPDAQWPLFTHTTNIALTTLEIDEIPSNGATMADVVNTLGLQNTSGQGKYYVSAGSLFARENWVPRIKIPRVP